MKTAISIPDELFAQAENLARHSNKPRSQVFCDALREYVFRHSPEEVTESMNSVVDEIGQPVDNFVRTAARRVLGRNEW
jgi:metal-responsive CopG/Arc/MetJ family transcriptional regulator